MTEYIEVLRAEVRVDIYGGPKCDEHKKYWNAYASGDMQDDNFEEPELTINLSDYPPGTKVSVKEPMCPKCDDTYENCMIRGSVGSCDFDWKNWAEEQYS